MGLRRGPLASAVSDFDWAALIEIGKRSGHVLCRCPRCGERQMCAYRPASKPWPVCKVCAPGSLTLRGGTGYAVNAPRVVPESDPPVVIHKRPGEPRTPTQLARDL